MSNAPTSTIARIDLVSPITLIIKCAMDLAKPDNSITLPKILEFNKFRYAITLVQDVQLS